MSKGRKPFIETATTQELLRGLKSSRSRFDELRQLAAHGPHVGLERGGWLASPGQERLWEMSALNDEKGEEIADYFMEVAFERRQARHQRMSTFAGQVFAELDLAAGRLLAAAQAHNS